MFVGKDTAYRGWVQPHLCWLQWDVKHVSVSHNSYSSRRAYNQWVQMFLCCVHQHILNALGAAQLSAECSRESISLGSATNTTLLSSAGC